MPPNDAELLRRFAAKRDEAAFAELVNRYLNLVYFAALRQVGGDAHRAEDVAQNVFTLLARKASSLLRHQALAGWLHTTTRFAASEAMRAERRRLVREQEAYAMHATSGDSGNDTEWDRLRPVIDEALAELGDADREAVLLRFFADQPLAAVGAKLQISNNAARMRIDRALDKLHALLAKRGVTSTAAALSAILATHAGAMAPAGLARNVASSALASLPAGVAAGAWSIAIAGKKLATGVAAAALMVTTGVWVYETREARAAEAMQAKTRSEVYALALRVDRAEREARAAINRSTTPRSAASADAPAAAPVEEEVRGPFGPEPPGSRARGRALMEAFPEIRRMLVGEKRDYFGAHYEKLYGELGLTAAQTEAFEMTMMAGVSSTYGAMNKSETVTLDAAPRLPPGEKDRRLRELLGERGYQRFEEFQRSPRDNRVTQLGSMLYFTDTPLTAEQAAQVQHVLTECNRAGFDRLPAEYWADAVARAQVFLSPPQVAALRRLQAADEFNYARAQNQKLRAPAVVDSAK
jgi:RNA polymerase sigma factor (sigma-70 family)